MKVVLVLLLWLSTFGIAARAQSCDEALVYSASSIEGTQVVAQTLCDDEVMPLNPALSDQFVTVDAWSTATNTLAYGFGTIFTLSEANPMPQVLLEESDTNFYSNPLWSPDGTHLVVTETEEESGVEWLAVTDLDGNVRRITQTISNMETETVIVPMAWSPDGEWISYGLSAQVDAQNWGTNILLLDTACIDDPAATCETHELAITDGSGERASMEFEGGSPTPEPWWGAAWSPDGEQIAFVCGVNLCFLNADGSSFRRSTIEFYGNNLIWSPSGQYIAYFAEGDIYLYDVAADEHINLTQTPDIQELFPIWIPLPAGEFLFEE